MEEVIINKIEWYAPEYKHKEKSIDFIWTIGLVTIVSCVIAFWLKNYLFAVFILISGASLILFSIRHPEDVYFSIEDEGFTLGKDRYSWTKIKGYNIKKENDESILLLEVDKRLLPVYTIPLPKEKTDQIKETLSKVAQSKDIEESKSMKFMEQLGF